MRVSRIRSIPSATTLVLLVALSTPATAPAQNAPDDDTGLLDDEAPPPLTEKETRESLKLFSEAKALLAKNRFDSARKKFLQFIKRYPGADPDLIEEAEDRSGENRLEGIEIQWQGGPPERRIDFELMGDGYIAAKRKSFRKDAKNQMKEFWAESLYGEYRNYINIWRFDLISAHDGVDELTSTERGFVPENETEKQRKRREKRDKKKKKYSTALDCKAAGPANQVWANPQQVMRWRKYFEHSDALTIAFAKKGQLGMGGGGIATTGKRVAVVHEVGHAFIGLLDEYSGNPNPPRHRIYAANAVSGDPDNPRDPPPVDEVPWKHWLSPGGKGIRGTDIGIFLGGATFSAGVFKPASGCAMNSGGNSRMCWVCREAGVLKIYEYVNPIDLSGPLQQEITMLEGEEREFFVQPMAPLTHDLKVEWYLQIVDDPSTLPAPPSEDGGYGTSVRDPGMRRWMRGGARARDRRADPLPEGVPAGAKLKQTRKKIKMKQKGQFFRSMPVLPGLPAGTYRLTARVWDDAKVPRYAQPWVIKDRDRLLEEWKTWILRVEAPRPAPAGDGEEDAGGK
ncbi:MAG: M64 family metallopeptidase [Planctomycetota bacterium]